MEKQEKQEMSDELISQVLVDIEDHRTHLSTHKEDIKDYEKCIKGLKNGQKKYESFIEEIEKAEDNEHKVFLIRMLKNNIDDFQDRINDMQWELDEARNGEKGLLETIERKEHALKGLRLFLEDIVNK